MSPGPAPTSVSVLRSGLPTLVGIVNVTPDSFSDGGRFLDPGAAVAHGERLVAEGAGWLDVGGESTRPGALPVPPEEQVRRVVPVLAALARALPGTTLSIDTTSPEVADRALEAGATVVNDVSGLADPELARVVARRRAGLVVMHTRGTPATMQRDTAYADLVGEVEAFLRERTDLARALGVAADRIVVDPGVGFGKAPLDNPALVAAVPRLRALGYPVLIGASRKGFVGRLTGVARPEDRVAGSIGAALAAAALGADLLRVHDVRPTRDALVVYAACTSGARGAEGDGGD